MGGFLKVVKLAPRSVFLHLLKYYSRASALGSNWPLALQKKFTEMAQFPAVSVFHLPM